MTLYAKAKAWNAGETVEFNGKRYPALYTPRNDTLISMFCITDDEQSSLRTIISRSMAAERHRKRDEARRRAAGAVERAEYLDAAQERRTRAQELRKQGMSVREIAKTLGIPRSSIHRYIKSDEVTGSHDKILPCPKSLRITTRRLRPPLPHYCSEQRPWEALGMSRATWYRRGKPVPQATGETVLAQVRPYY